jgi:tetratricopeptide (TPR) repeat protein
MNKRIISIFLAFVALSLNAQKLQLTEAATEYKNNFSKSWMMQPDQLPKNKATLLKAKKAIDGSYGKQTTTPSLPAKLLTKMYYYRGMIYLDYMMMAAMDKDILTQVEAVGEDELNEASFGSLKKCIELDVKNQWKSDITRKIDGLRGMSINGGVQLFQNGDYKNSYEAFKGAVLMYDVISIPDTLAMVNAALAAEKMKSYDNAYTYYKMCADNNYGKGAEMYQSMIRVLIQDEKNNDDELLAKVLEKHSKDSELYSSLVKVLESESDDDKLLDYIQDVNTKDAEMYKSMMSILNQNKNDDKILSVIEEGKVRFPKDYVLNVEEFNFWYAKGDNDKAQQALQKAIEADPTNKQLHFNIGVTYDNLSNKSHDNKEHDKAFEYMSKAIEGYQSAIAIDAEYVDAYYNLGALYYNQSITLKSVAGDYSGEKYDSEMARADEMLKKAIPSLEKVLKLAPSDKSTLRVLKSLYFNLDDMDNYSRVKKQLEAL